MLADVAINPVVELISTSDPRALAAGVVVLLLLLGSAVVLGVRGRRRRQAWLEGGETPRALPTPSSGGKEAPPSNLLARLTRGLSRTQEALVGRIDKVLLGRKIDDALYEELEEILIRADVGIGTTTRLLEAVRKNAERSQLSDASALRGVLRDEILSILERSNDPLKLQPEGPTIILMVGVNGAGKTTTIGKLASRYGKQGRSVVIGAGDTFRAAAIEQLEVWAQRAEARFVRQDEGSDSAAVLFDTVKSGVAKNEDLILLDTAGRLQSNAGLMEELAKVKRAITRAHPGAPHDVLLVMDANTGQNGVSQARLFRDEIGVTGLVLTKLDGTPKGGVVVRIVDELGLPVKLIGIGESVEDLRDFDPNVFVSALFGES